MARKRKPKTQVKVFSYHPIGTLYSTPSVWVSAVADGNDVMTIESPSLESACYPTAPWQHRYTQEQFFNFAFHKSWSIRLTQAELELALMGQLYNRQEFEWPETYTLRFNYKRNHSHTQNLNDLRRVPTYDSIGHHIIM